MSLPQNNGNNGRASFELNTALFNTKLSGNVIVIAIIIIMSAYGVIQYFQLQASLAGVRAQERVAEQMGHFTDAISLNTCVIALAPGLRPLPLSKDNPADADETCRRYLGLEPRGKQQSNP